jgi:peptide methionine sulfoxide reductase MsrB
LYGYKDSTRTRRQQAKTRNRKVQAKKSTECEIKVDTKAKETSRPNYNEYIKSHDIDIYVTIEFSPVNYSTTFKYKINIKAQNT